MLLSNLDIINSISILDRYSDMKLPQCISYAITRNIIILQQEYNCYKKEFEKLLSQYSEVIERDGNGELRFQSNGVPIIHGPAADQFNADLTSLLSIKLDVNLVNTTASSGGLELAL